MTDPVAIALVAAIPGILVAVGALFVSVWNALHIGKVATQLDGVLADRLSAEHSLGRMEVRAERAEVLVGALPESPQLGDTPSARAGKLPPS